MQSTAEIIDQLWAQGKALISTNYGEKFQVVLSRPQNFIDVVISSNRETRIGFITLKDEGQGKYSIVNETQINYHPSFINTPGHGIEVNKKYRKRGIGGALISLGIGMIKKDRQAYKKSRRFMIVASDITNQGLGCYQHFGFTVREGMSVSAAYYMSCQPIPEINILANKVSPFKRLRSRLRVTK